MNIFDREIILLGDEKFEKLKNSHAAVFGLGGVGSFAAEALARSGIGKLTIFDCDKIDETNINRQLYAINSTIGLAKTEVAKKRILDINPECTVETNETLLTENNIADIKFDFNYAIDAIDTLTAKTMLIKILKENQITFISSMGSAGKMDISKIEIIDISKTHTCPLARKLRKNLKKHEIYKNVPVVFSSENSRNSTNNEILEKNPLTSKAPLGTISYIPPSFGLYAASYIIREIVI